ncbi:MAG TPA: hypothetical protein VNA04_18725 [Thermoanaerobaculia bacterium]|nr:hypothetical protein [Thermoanaerobaculia bacterium]
MSSSLLILLALAQPFDWSAVGPERASVTAIAAGETMLAGTAQGRLFRAAPDGTWSAAGQLPPPIRAIAGGWVLAGHDLHRPEGDGWIRISSGVEDFAVAPGAAYAATAAAILASSDGGSTWLSHPGGAVSIAIDAGDPRFVWAVRPDGSVEKSSDGGSTWTRSLEPAAAIRRVQAHPRRPRTAFAVADSGRGFRTTDGVAWSEIPFLAGTITFHPHLEQSFYLVGDEGGLFRSDNDGEGAGIVHSGPILSLAIDARDGTLLAGFREEGIQRSADGGETWVPHRQGLLAAEIHALAAAPDAGVVYAGSVSTLFRTHDRGASWEPVFTLRTLPGPWRAIAVDETDPQRVWAGAGVSLWFSGDGGVRFNRLLWLPEREPETIRAVAVDAAERRAAWVLTSGGFFRLETEPLALIELSPSSAAAGRFEALAVDPAEPRSIWIGGTRDDDALLLHSADGGRTWDDVTPRIRISGISAPVTALHVDRRSGPAVLAGLASGRLLRSDDGGNIWRASDHRLAGAGPIAAIASDGTSLFVAANGVFVSGDGQSWRNAGGAIGHRPVTALTSSEVVFAGTNGSGVFAQRAVRARRRAAGR